MIEVNKQIKDHGVKLLKEVGIKKGDIIFDCCCGEGNYTLPAAEITNKNGMVYAMDMNKNKTDTLKQKSNLENLKNIKIIEKEFIQMGTHPMLTASPIAYQISNAAEMAVKELRK